MKPLSFKNTNLPDEAAQDINIPDMLFSFLKSSRHILSKMILFFAGVILSVYSCEQVFLSTPQPVDSKNLYSFPKEFRGAWTNEEDSLIIDKNFYQTIRNTYSSIPKFEVDTSSFYLLTQNKIYFIDKEDELKLSGGFTYKLENDTVSYIYQEISELALGKNAFLRKVKDNYILNVCEDKQWWQLFLIRKEKNGKILVLGLNRDNLNKAGNYKLIHTANDECNSIYDYIEANWTKNELLEMINKGIFSDTFYILGPTVKTKDSEIYSPFVFAP